MKTNPEHTPVYLTIFSELRDQIVNGSFAPGQIIPSENELCSRYNTTRETVRKGLKQLEQDGLIFPVPDEVILSIIRSMMNLFCLFQNQSRQVQENIKISES